MEIDTIVSITRDKGHKPDELYRMAERMAGIHSRKLELFGGIRNIRPGWLSKFFFCLSFLNHELI